MSKLATQLQDAVAADLTKGKWSIAGLEVRQALTPKPDLLEANPLLLVVIGERTNSLDGGTRQNSEKQQDIQVGFLHKLTTNDPLETEYQPLIDFVDTTLAEFFRDKTYVLPSGLTAHFISIEWPNGLYSPDHVIDRNQFTSVSTLTFLAI